MIDTSIKIEIKINQQEFLMSESIFETKQMYPNQIFISTEIDEPNKSQNLIYNRYVTYKIEFSNAAVFFDFSEMLKTIITLKKNKK